MKGIYKNKSKLFKFAFFLLLCVCSLIAGILSTLLIKYLFFSSVSNIAENIFSNKYLTVISIALSSIFLFLIPSLLYAYFCERSLKKYFFRYSKIPFSIFVFSLLLLFCSIPFVQFLGKINSNIPFPDSMMNWIMQQESAAQNVIMTIVSLKGVGGFFINIFIIALLAAVCEEFFFRGIIQKSLIRTLGNDKHHFAICLAALIFSLAHFQFLGFLPRFILGLILGYLYYYSRNLIVPMFFHFANNLCALIAIWKTGKISQGDIHYTKFEILNGIIPIISLLIIVVLTNMIANRMKKVSYFES